MIMRKLHDRERPRVNLNLLALVAMRAVIAEGTVTAAAHFGLVQGLVGLPQLVRLHATITIPWFLDGLGEFFDLSQARLFPFSTSLR